MSKWTWTLFVAFGPTIFLAPSQIWFILFAFRNEIFIVYKNILNEYRKQDKVEEVNEEIKKW